MLIPNHPDDERLSAFAARDDDAVADGPLAAHVDECDRCTALVTELGALRASLAGLPDLAPHRPLRLLPPVAAPAPGVADRLGGWVRRFFTPALAAGAALAMVGLVGTAAPALDGMAGGPDTGATLEQLGSEADDGEAPRDGGGAAGADEETGIMSASDAPDVDTMGGSDERAATDDAGGSATTTQLPAERSPWPMVLFTGVALLIGAVLLRWILQPRAG